MKSILALAVAGLLALMGPRPSGAAEPFIFFGAADQSQSGGIGWAWWLRPFIARPMGTTVTNVPLSMINAFQPDDEGNDWCWAELLTQKSYVGLTRELQGEIDATMNLHQPSFRVSGPLTGNGVQEASAGIFEDCHGGQGVFLLIAEPATSRVLHLETWTDWPGSVIWLALGAHGGLEFGSCFECGHAEALFYDQRRERFYRENLGD